MSASSALLVYFRHVGAHAQLRLSLTDQAEKEQVSRELARRLVWAVIMASLGSEAEREPLVGPGSSGSR